MNPSKFLSPYSRREDFQFIRYERTSLNGNTVNSSIWLNKRPRFFADDKKWDHCYVPMVGAFSSAEEAMEDLDERLLKLGYKLLTQEQFDKLRLLI